jgi:hypothetical protein
LTVRTGWGWGTTGTLGTTINGAVLHPENNNVRAIRKTGNKRIGDIQEWEASGEQIIAQKILDQVG